MQVIGSSSSMSASSTDHMWQCAGALQTGVWYSLPALLPLASLLVHGSPHMLLLLLLLLLLAVVAVLVIGVTAGGAPIQNKWRPHGSSQLKPLIALTLSFRSSSSRSLRP